MLGLIGSSVAVGGGRWRWWRALTATQAEGGATARETLWTLTVVYIVATGL